MTARSLDKAITAFRIGDPSGAYGIFSGEGAKQNPGRWNGLGQNMIYTSEHFSTAMLEKLVRLGEMPPNQHFIEITFQRGVSYEVFDTAKYSDWHKPDRAQSQSFGSDWFDQLRSAILIVPSVVARPENNILINPSHPDFSHISTGLEKPIWWDTRLFSA